ncbi:MAG TPA: hypothetical protein DDW21_07210 [Verrucomicrobiales bacterium]|nr:MAG: hypothetical protein B9S37_04955 [Verrucomicrobiae bacterium Tous-C3TDCM]PAZ07197.1 MAG: hypothetical protein CAK88_00345 [Verrucomicrobiae bacterium AMD-G2]HBE23217.1 hypothetical protein [Verrucomicrobiales bacterium]
MKTIFMWLSSFALLCLLHFRIIPIADSTVRALWMGLIFACTSGLLLPQGFYQTSKRHWLWLAMYVAGSLLFFLHVPPVLERGADAVQERWFPEKRRTLPLIEQQTGTPKAQSGNWLWNDQTIRALPRRANLRPGTQPEVFVQMDSRADAAALLTARAYVSAFALGTYQNAAWSLTPNDTSSAPRFPQRPSRLYSYEIFHSADPSGQSLLLSLQGMRDVAIEPLSYRGDGVLVLPALAAGTGYRYRGRSQPLHIDDLTDDVKAAPRTSVPSPWLALPVEENIEIGIRGLNAESITHGTLKSQLKQIRDAIRQECAYSLDIENPENLDPLENFLFHEKRGHCEMFATAGAVCARALGIPARIAYGWAGGTYYESSNLFVFRAREAHAWTEVLIDGIGWVVMDCTPAASIGNSQTAPPDASPLTDMQQHEQATEDSSSTLPVGPLSSVLLGIFVLCMSVVMFFACRAERKQPSTLSWSTALPDPGYYQAFLQYLRVYKLVHSPALTLRQLLARMKSTPQFAKKLLAYHYSTRYGTREPDALVEKELEHEICAEHRGRD